jgi:(1->4)-alpha-D-glucan 1-alpha-D-glucosylmutase
MTDSTRVAAAPASRQRAIVPRATYRVQLHSGFGFADAMQLVPYLAELGISHLYISPPLRARAGSQHGYDVVDHGVAEPGARQPRGLRRLVDALHAHGMGLVVDIVPNHMGVLSGDNAWWLDVLEHGAASPWAEFFDIDWRRRPGAAGKVLLPILGDQYGVVLERGELRLAFDAAAAISRWLPRAPAARSIRPRYGALLLRALRAPPAQELPTGRRGPP